MKVFFRNDDVNVLDKELMNLMSVFESQNVPIVMAVEPANVTKETVEWLKYKKKNLERLYLLYNMDMITKIGSQVKENLEGVHTRTNLVILKKGKG